MKCKLICFLLYIENLIIDSIMNLLFSSYEQPNECREVLIFRTGSLGDGICAMPAISRIRKSFPKANINILTNASSKKNKTSIGDLIDDGLYNVIYYDTYKDLFSITRKGNYDLFIELTQDYTPLFKQLRNMFIIRISGVSHAFGWGVQSIKRLSKWQEECGLITSENDRLNKVLAKESIIINSTDACYDFKISKSDKNIVDNLYHSLSLDKNEKVITFVVGAKRPMNIWPIGYFVEVAKYLISQDYNILLVGGKGDVDNAAQLIKLKGVINIIGKTTPIQTGLIMSKTKLVISNDTGGMHLSYTFNTPVVAIFSSRDCSVKWYPPNKSSKVFKAESINCSHCFSETCIDNICMKSIKPEHIINYLKEVGF